MTQIFNKDGVIIPVTVVEAGPCTIIQNGSQRPRAFQCNVSPWEYYEKYFLRNRYTHFVKKDQLSETCRQNIRSLEPLNTQTFSPQIPDKKKKGSMVRLCG